MQGIVIQKCKTILKINLKVSENINRINVIGTYFSCSENCFSTYKSGDYYNQGIFYRACSSNKNAKVILARAYNSN